MHLLSVETNNPVLYRVDATLTIDPSPPTHEVCQIDEHLVVGKLMVPMDRAPLRPRELCEVECDPVELRVEPIRMTNLFQHELDVIVVA